jgi:RHS repeat-associated protein
MPGPLGGSVSLFENGYRWYRTAWGRYTQADPMAQRLGTTRAPGLYSYTNGNPLRRIDEYGLWDLDRPCDRYETFFGSKCCRDGSLNLDPYPVLAKTACEGFLGMYSGNQNAYCVAICLPEKENQIQRIGDCSLRNTLRLIAHVDCYRICAFFPYKGTPPGAMDVGAFMLLPDFVDVIRTW